MNGAWLGVIGRKEHCAAYVEVQSWGVCAGGKYV